MEIKRKNLKYNRIINPNEVINDSAVFFMNQKDIDADIIVKGERLEDGDNMIVLQNIVEPNQNERYCYLKTSTLVGGDGHTKQITINKIIIDSNFINKDVFKYILTILLQQENNEYPNRIVITNRFNKRFSNRIDEVANKAAELLCQLFTFTSDIYPNHIIP